MRLLHALLSALFPPQLHPPQQRADPAKRYTDEEILSRGKAWSGNAYCSPCRRSWHVSRICPGLCIRIDGIRCPWCQTPCAYVDDVKWHQTSREAESAAAS